jgi:tetratricopeptide (TPR) repeat protein
MTKSDKSFNFYFAAKIGITMFNIVNFVSTRSMITLAIIFALSTATSAQRAPDTTAKTPAPAAATTPPQEGLRPDIAKPLQAAQEMLQMKQFKEAMAKIDEAAMLANRTPYELFIIERMRGTAAAAMGDNAVSAKSFEAVLATNRLAPAERILFAEAITAAHYNLKDYKAAAIWSARAIKEGSTLAQIRILLIQSLFLSDDFVAAKTEVDAAIADIEKAGKVPTEDMLKLMGRIALKQKDTLGYKSALEKLVTHYPTKDYWADWIARVAVAANMTDRNMQHVFRLQLTMGENLTASQYIFLARSAVEAGFPIDAKQILDSGFQANVLGMSAEHKTLRDKVTKDAADDTKNMARTSTEAANLKTGPGLFNTGLNVVISGDKPKGIAMMEEGIKRLNAKPLEDAKLRLGMAYTVAGNREKAIAILATINGADGLTEVAKLWGMYAKQLKVAQP